jgi:hypothetical protein
MRPLSPSSPSGAGEVLWHRSGPGHPQVYGGPAGRELGCPAGRPGKGSCAVHPGGAPARFCSAVLLHALPPSLLSPSLLPPSLLSPSLDCFPVLHGCTLHGESFCLPIHPAWSVPFRMSNAMLSPTHHIEMMSWRPGIISVASLPAPPAGPGAAHHSRQAPAAVKPLLHTPGLGGWGGGAG